MKIYKSQLKKIILEVMREGGPGSGQKGHKTPLDKKQLNQVFQKNGISQYTANEIMKDLGNNYDDPENVKNVLKKYLDSHKVKKIYNEFPDF